MRIYRKRSHSHGDFRNGVCGSLRDLVPLHGVIFRNCCGKKQLELLVLPSKLDNYTKDILPPPGTATLDPPEPPARFDSVMVDFPVPAYLEDHGT